MHTTGAAARPLAGPALWVHLMPIGPVRTRAHDGRAPWAVRDAAGVVAATRALGLPLPVDYEHQTDLAASNGRPAPAAGWIVAFEARADGIFGQVEWTARARAMIAAGEYRYLSPVFQFDGASREVKRILRAGLTNDPALFVKAVAEVDGEALNEAELAVRAAMQLSPGEYAAARSITAEAGAVPSDGLSETERAVCAALGLSPEAFALSRASPAKRGRE